MAGPRGRARTTVNLAVWFGIAWLAAYVHDDVTVPPHPAVQVRALVEMERVKVNCAELGTGDHVYQVRPDIMVRSLHLYVCVCIHIHTSHVLHLCGIHCTSKEHAIPFTAK